ncbi:MAG: hypothetical protein IKC04_02310, partial [Oscillospiraceae bacterium]|nr:hypothetical protein [Oscillospiraceae bacterium]
KEQLAILAELLDRIEADRAAAYADGKNGVLRPDLEKPWSGKSKGRKRAFAVMLHALKMGAYRKGQAERAVDAILEREKD